MSGPTNYGAHSAAIPVPTKVTSGFPSTGRGAFTGTCDTCQHMSDDLCENKRSPNHGRFAAAPNWCQEYVEETRTDAGGPTI